MTSHQIADHDPFRLSRSEPINLTQANGAFYVTDGSVQIFLAENSKDSPDSGQVETSGGRRFLFEVQAGEMFFGGVLSHPTSDTAKLSEPDPFAAFGDDVAMFAVGGHATRVVAFSDIDWADKIPNEIGVSRLINLIDQWVDHLLSSSGALLQRPAEFQAMATATSLETANAGDLFSAYNETLWVQQELAAHLMFETIQIGQASYVPVNERSWYMATQSGPLSAKSTGQMFQDGLVWSCLESFQSAMLDFLPETLRLLAGDDVNQQNEFERNLKSLSASSFTQLHSAVSGDVESQTHVELTSHLELAFARVCRALKIEYQPVKLDSGSGKRECTLDDILDSNSVRLREVKMTTGWADQDSGPLLFIDLATGEPAALLRQKSSRFGRYRYWRFDPATRETHPVTNDEADAMSGQTYMPYPPLPNGPINAKTFIRRIFDNRLADLLVIAVLSVVGGILGMGVPIAVGFIIDDIVPAGDFQRLFELVIALFAVGSCIILCRYASQMAVLRMEGWAGGRLEAGIVDRVLRLPISVLNSFSSGDLASRAMVVRSVEQVFTGALINTLLNGVFALFAIGLLFSYSVKLALVALLFCILIVGVNFFLGYISLAYQRRDLDLSGKITGTLFQTLLGIEKIRLSAAEVPRFHHWSGQYATLTKNIITARRIQMISSTLSQSGSVAGLLLVFAAIHFLGLAENGMTTGSIAAFLAAFGNAMSGLLGLSGILLSLIGLKPILEHAQPILEATPESTNLGDAVETLTGRIDLEQIHYTYPNAEHPVLHGVTASILPGQSVGIVGSSGSGKSTLVKLLLAFNEPDHGSILYNGRSLAGLDKSGVRRQIGVVLQDGRLMAGSILDNIRGGNDQITEQEAWDAAKHVAMDTDIRGMPMRMHTLIADKATLSGGQIQRLMIARALVSKPRIIILDEATSALDNATQKAVSETLNHLGVTRISIAHRISTIRNCDVVFVMDKGRIVETGDYDTLIAKDGLFADLAARQTNAT